jgi:hypothetical protein
MADAEDNGNGRVTTAVLRNDIMHLSDDFSEFRDEVRDWRCSEEARLRAVETLATELKTNQTQLLDDAKKGDHNNNVFSAAASIVSATVAGVAAVLVAGMGK